MKIILLTLLLVSILFSQDTLRLCTGTAKDSYNNLFLESVYKRVADSLNMVPYYSDLPNLRSVEKLRNGTIMLDMARTKSYIHLYNDLILLPVLIGETNFIAISRDSNLVLDGWKSLQGKNYRVDYIRGIVLVEQSLTQYISKENIFPQNSIKQCINRLLINRCDLIILMENDYAGWIQKNPDHKYKTHAAGTMMSFKAYPVLSPRHINLQKPLIRILTNLRNEGIIDSLWENQDDEWEKFIPKPSDTISTSND